MRELAEAEAARRALIKRFRSTLWQPFVAAVKRYGLLSPGGELAVRLDGGGASLIAALLLDEMHHHSEFPFGLFFTAAGNGHGQAEFFGLPLTEEPPAGAARVCADCQTDVVEEALGHMLAGEGIRTLLPAETPAGGGRRVRPLYCVKRRDLARWCQAFGFPAPGDPPENRKAAHQLLEEMRRMNPQAEDNLFHALHKVFPDTFPVCSGGDALEE